MKKKIIDNEICVCCGLYVKSFLCDRDRIRYIYYEEHNFVAFKPRRRMSKIQSSVYRKTRGIFKSPCFQEVIFPFMLFYRMDIVVPEYKAIIEYDSKIHFEFNKHFHKTKKNFEHRQELDDVKENIVKENGWKVLRINYKDKDADIERKLKWFKKKCRKK